MGRLIKNHLARLMSIAAALFAILASIMGFFWPKMFFDWLTTNLDFLVKPIPYLQICNIIFAVIVLAFEYPLPFLAKTRIHASFEIRFLVYPFVAWASMLMYQGTNPAIGYLISIIFWAWAYCEGETIRPEPWTLPPPPPRKGTAKA